MRVCTRVMLTAAIILVAMASFAVGGSARNLSISEQRYDMRWTAIELISGLARIKCNVKLTGSFHYRTFAKVNQSLIGYINSTRIETCTEGSIAVPGTSLPWHVQYSSFTGTLPTIQTLRSRIVGAVIRVTERGGAACEYTTETGHPLVTILTREAGRIITEVRPSAADVIPGVLICAAVSLRWEEKRGEFTKQGTAEAILLTLI